MDEADGIDLVVDMDEITIVLGASRAYLSRMAGGIQLCDPTSGIRFLHESETLVSVVQQVWARSGVYGKWALK
jgi:hypothetical protein